MTVSQIIGYYLKVRYVPIICHDIYERPSLLDVMRERDRRGA